MDRYFDVLRILKTWKLPPSAYCLLPLACCLASLFPVAIGENHSKINRFRICARPHIALVNRGYMPGSHNEIEKRLWDAADELRANSALKSSGYSVPVLGLIFLRYADHKFSQVEKQLAERNSGRRKIGKNAPVASHL